MLEVRAQLPGAGAGELAASVTAPLERELAAVPHVAAISSATTAGATRIRIVMETADEQAATSAIQAAIDRTRAQLPATLPVPPVSSVVDPHARRLLVPRGEVPTGIVLADTCGETDRAEMVDVDPARLATFGLAVSDVLDAVSGGGSPRLLAEREIGTRSGAPVYVRDVAQVHDTSEPADCLLVTPSNDRVEIVVAATPTARLVEVPRAHELHAELAPDVDLAQAAAGIHEALAHAGGSYVVEVRRTGIRVFGGGDPALAALRRLPFVMTAGEPTAVVHVTGETAPAYAATLAARMREAGRLVATHGLAVGGTRRYEIDREAAARLGASTNEVATALASTGGLATGQGVIVHTPGLDGLYVHGLGEALVPLSSIVSMTTVVEPLEVLHRGQQPDVDLEVHGEPAIGAVPAGVHVEVDQAW